MEGVDIPEILHSNKVNKTKAALNSDNIESYRKSATKTANYTILDDDLLQTIYVTTSTTNRTITLPAAANNTDREIIILKNDSGSGYVIIDGAGAETIDYHGIQQTTIQAELQDSGIRIKSNGTSWKIINVIGGEIENINGVLELVYKKYLSGTTLNSTKTTVAHGLSDTDKITRFSCHVESASVSKKYRASDYQLGSSVTTGWSFWTESTLIHIQTTGTDTRLALYRILIDYYI